MNHKWGQPIEKMALFAHTYARTDPEAGDRGSGPPLKNHKNIGFHTNTDLDPL